MTNVASSPDRRNDGGGSKPARTPGEGREPDLDELARRLVGPLSRLLRTELRLDRERMGRLRDPRR
ncbi:hypothetical protein [Actinomadura gamaensis]|uniref:Uncharacterized protein n=1 Tax=Actinomadura gamaensis TaxID=1763541 RepID=A0ABV9TZN5_9ACTN